MREQNHRQFTRIEHLLQKMLGIGTGGIKADEENAIEQIQEKIEMLIKFREQTKNAKAHFKKYQTLDDIELDGSLKETLLSDIRVWGAIAHYRLEYFSRDIRHLEQRKKNIEAMKNKEKSSFTSSFFEFEENKEDMRLRLFFDGKPDEATRNILKSNGFKWSPKNQAWQRLLNANSLSAMRRVNELLSK